MAYPASTGWEKEVEMKPGTPLPWGVGREHGTSAWSESLPDGCTLIISKGTPFALGVDVAAVPSGGMFDPKQDAAYIVHAANLYPELVEACQLALEHKASEYQGTFDSSMDNDPLVIRLRAVLAKAKGE